MRKVVLSLTLLSGAYSVLAFDGASAQPILMLTEPRDVDMAKYSCGWAEAEIKSSQYLIKAFKCGESELCQRAMDIDAACKVGGPIREVRGFHSKLLAQFASNAQCAITIMRLSDDKSEYRANWELNLGFTPGAMKQTWALWPWEPGKGISPAPVLEVEGDPAQIAKDVCTIVTRGGAKILN